MNWFGVLTVVLAFAAYLLGLKAARRATASKAIYLGALMLAIPALVYDIYYSRILGEPLWLYRLRAIPGSELLAAPAGLFAGWMQGRLIPSVRLSPLGKRFLVPVVLGFAVALPYLKPLLRPLRSDLLKEEWKGQACVQSTPSTCGPAAAATIVRQLGGRLTERELARESFTCRSGTENWYLARALQRHGFLAEFRLGDATTVTLPAVAGVRLRSLGNSGHFIALLERQDDRLVVADPMEGLSTNSNWMARTSSPDSSW